MQMVRGNGKEGQIDRRVGRGGGQLLHECPRGRVLGVHRVEPEAKENGVEAAGLRLGGEDGLHRGHEGCRRLPIAGLISTVEHEVVAEGGLGEEGMAAHRWHGGQRPPQENLAFSLQVAENRREHRDGLGFGGVGEGLAPEREGVADRGRGAEQILGKRGEGRHPIGPGGSLRHLLRELLGPRVGPAEERHRLLQLLHLRAARLPGGIDRGLRIGKPPQLRRQRRGDRRKLQAAGGRDSADYRGVEVRIASEVGCEGLRLVDRERRLVGQWHRRSGERIENSRCLHHERSQLGSGKQQKNWPPLGAPTRSKHCLCLLLRHTRQRLEDGRRLGLPTRGQISQEGWRISFHEVHPALGHEHGALKRQCGHQCLGSLERLVQEVLRNGLVGPEQRGRFLTKGNDGHHPVDPRLDWNGKIRHRRQLACGLEPGRVRNRERFQSPADPLEIRGMQSGT